MLLSQFFADADVTIVRDGCFETLALSNHQPRKKSLSFIDDRRFLEELTQNRGIACVICLPEFVTLLATSISGIVVSESPRLAFFKTHNYLCRNGDYIKKTYKTTIGKDCEISPLAYISPENVQIGDNVLIEEFASIRGHCVIGNGSKIRSGVQIGGEGYEFKQDGESFISVSHAGGVIIGENVEVWSCSSIHKAVFPWDNTVIGSETKINSQTHIDHGAKIGKLVKICAGAIISGRVCIGDGAFIGPNCVVANRININNDAKVSLGSAVTKDVKENMTVSGNFAIEHNRFLENLKKSVL